MQKTEELVKWKRGRLCTIRLDIKDWRRKMRRFNKLKGEVLAWLEATGWPPEQMQAWLSTPLPELRGRPPKAMFHPRRMGVLHSWTRKLLRKYHSV
jgi:hypothetical protein